MKRRLTVYAFWRAARDFHYHRSAVVPHVRLVGRWLHQAGFRVGQRITVSVEDGALIIRPE